MNKHAPPLVKLRQGAYVQEYRPDSNPARGILNGLLIVLVMVVLAGLGAVSCLGL